MKLVEGEGGEEGRSLADPGVEALHVLGPSASGGHSLTGAWTPSKWARLAHS